MKALIDTNIITLENIINILHQKGFTIYIAKTTHDREIKDTTFYKYVNELKISPESFLFGESTFPIRLGPIKNLFEILNIISSGSFPVGQNELTSNQRNQLRDAMILESAIIQCCDIFCSNDTKAFFKHGKKEKIEEKFPIKIYTSADIENGKFENSHQQNKL